MGSSWKEKLMNLQNNQMCIYEWSSISDKMQSTGMTAIKVMPYILTI